MIKLLCYWQDGVVKVEAGLEQGCMMGVAGGLDEEDEEEVQKVEHWTNSLINQGSFDASAHVKDIHNWQRECQGAALAHSLHSGWLRSAWKH